MKRRVCESCLYFESAGFSKNGWCHHPSRRQNTDVRLMVRSNELNCRNGWNADLWVAAATDGDVQLVQPLDSIAGRARSEIAPAQQNDLITSILAAKTDNIPLPEDRPVSPPVSSPMVRPVVEEDIFVRQTPSLSWDTGPISSQPATELVQNPKAAILRARDQFRQRRRQDGRIADQQVIPSPAPLLASAREAQLVHDLDLVEPDPAPESIDPRYENRPLVRPVIQASDDDRRPVSPVRRVEIERPFPSMTDFPEDHLRFESVPSLEAAQDDVVLGAEQHDTWLETRQIDTVPPEPYEVDELFEEDELVAYAEAEFYEEEELSVQHRESILNRFLRQRRERQHPSDGVDYEDESAYDQPDYHESPRIAAETWQAPETLGANALPAVETRVEHVHAQPEPSVAQMPDVRAPVQPVRDSAQVQHQIARPAREPIQVNSPFIAPNQAEDALSNTARTVPSAQSIEAAYEEDIFIEPERTLPPAQATWNRREVEQVREVAAFVDAEITQQAERSWATDSYRETESYRVANARREPASYRANETHRDVVQPRPRQEPRRYAEPVTDLDDEFIIPPPLPEYQPKVQAEQQQSSARPRPRMEPTSPARRPEIRQEPQHIADEFGDQPLFASQPLPPVDDYQVHPPNGSNARAAYPAVRTERICQTCRDFRPSDNGERGWCNNKWAFNHRRMVDADDLACRNSLGSWWTPKDDVWRRDGDISRHAQQTPRVDQWLFGSDSNDTDRRKSGS